MEFWLASLANWYGSHSWENLSIANLRLPARIGLVLRIKTTWNCNPLVILWHPASLDVMALHTGPSDSLVRLPASLPAIFPSFPQPGTNRYHQSLAIRAIWSRYSCHVTTTTCPRNHFSPRNQYSRSFFFHHCFLTVFVLSCIYGNGLNL